jgi:Tfp pilus assembly protein PilW
MKRLDLLSRSRRAFTVAELMIGAAVTCVMFTAMLAGMVALQRSYSASSYYAEAVNDQVRALDYIVRDTRGALTSAISVDQNTLTLTLPDYYSSYDAQGNPNGPPRGPTISPTSSNVVYGDPTKPITVTYSVTNGALIRQVKIGATNVTAQAVIATGIDNPDFSFSAVDSTLTASITFSPRFRGISSSTSIPTTRSATIYMRNHKS